MNNPLGPWPKIPLVTNSGVAKGTIYLVGYPAFWRDGSVNIVKMTNVAQETNACAETDS